MLAQENDIDLEKLFTFPLGPVPWPLATGDGILVKTDKVSAFNAVRRQVYYKTVGRIQGSTREVVGRVHPPEYIRSSMHHLRDILIANSLTHGDSDT